ncbi:PREDICTED: uncharacterized protein LOC108372549 [Rhagoletis zephyria]|uniref:uncharacterized protein LOC108372549 n=1 Tax=Rhagoletis zephyria TaxID=28612 RepID=UPI0008114855|nr:PREDICTED: uncharacterized protein LOC108372549 [Rhagoletis zephyria]
MEIDVNLRKTSAIELMTISAGSYSINNKLNNNNSTSSFAVRPVVSGSPPSRRIGCCGILGRLIFAGGASTAKTGSADYHNFNSLPIVGNQQTLHTTAPAPLCDATVVSSVCKAGNTCRPQSRRTPQEVYFESRGKSCKKLLKFNGYSNKWYRAQAAVRMTIMIF